MSREYEIKDNGYSTFHLPKNNHFNRESLFFYVIIHMQMKRGFEKVLLNCNCLKLKLENEKKLGMSCCYQ
jgi:hypothetical protein